ncbi:MAG TPA: tetratricopeptide repeat protein, partial [Gemmataceae bacterium]|nr:tetratricopeptide repeat protein [Gemmataceae bacterium]
AKEVNPTSSPQGFGDLMPARMRGVFSPDGRRVLLMRGPSVRVWDVATGRSLTPPLRPGQVVQYAAFSPDGRRLLTETAEPGNFKSAEPQVRVWDVNEGRPLTPPLPHGPGHASFSPDGRLLLTTQKRAVRVWDAGTGQAVTPPLEHPAEVASASFGPEGRRLLVRGGNEVSVWSLLPPESSVGLGALAWLAAARSLDPSGSFVALEPDVALAAWKKVPPGESTRGQPAEDPLLSWHRRQATACEKAKDWPAALFHLERLIAADPKSGDFHFRRGVAHAKLQHWKEAIADYTQAIDRGVVSDMGPRGWVVYWNRGLDQARLGLWEQASADLTRAVEWQEAGPLVWYQHALLRLHLGDAEGYRWACATLLDRFGEAKEAHHVNLALWTCVLGPGAVPDPNRLVELFDQAVTGPIAQAPQYASTRRAALFRAGRFEAAMEGRWDPSSPQDLLFQAMARWRQGRHDEARKALDEVRKRIGGRSPEQTSWEARLEVEVLRREAEGLVKPADDKPEQGSRGP